MKVLLTGGTGQVGSELRARAAGLDLRAPGREEFDLARADGMRHWLEREQPDVILSVGAYTAVDRAEDEPDLAYAINRDAPALLAEYCAAHGKTLLHLSTDYVFDGGGDQAYAESAAVAPIGVYGHSKAQGEAAVRHVARHVILRVSWVFAAHGGNFVKTMLRLGATRDSLGVVDDQVGGPTWAGHIAQALLQLTRRIEQGEQLPWGTYHFAGAPALSWCGFARCIFDRALSLGMLPRAPVVNAIATADYPTRARRPANSRLDMQQAVQVLGLDIPDWRIGLDATLETLSAST